MHYAAFLSLGVLLFGVIELRAQTFDQSEFRARNKDKIVFVEAFPDNNKLPSELRAAGSGVLLKGRYVLTARHFAKKGDITGPKSMVFTGRVGGAEAVQRNLYYVGQVPDHDLLLFQFGEDAQASSFACRRPPDVPIAAGEPLVIMGFPQNAYDVAGEQRPQHTLDIQPGSVSSVELGRIFSGVNITYGHSGAPVFDVRGRVIGIVRGELKTSDGEQKDVTIIVPIERAEPILPHIAARASGSECGVRVDDSIIVLRKGRAIATVLGDTGELAKRIREEKELGSQARVAGNGGERNECKDQSGRTTSNARADAGVYFKELDGVTFSYELAAQGGHYRTSAGPCFGDYHSGIKPRDTSSYSEVDMIGEIHFAVGQKRSIRVVWENLPSAKLSMSGGKGAGEATSALTKGGSIVGNGSSVASLVAGENYILAVTLNRSLKHSGVADPRRELGSPSFRVTFEE